MGQKPLWNRMYLNFLKVRKSQKQITFYNFFQKRTKQFWSIFSPSLFPIGIYDTDKHYTTNQSWGKNHYVILFEFGDIKGPSFHQHYFLIGLYDTDKHYTTNQS